MNKKPPFYFLEKWPTNLALVSIMLVLIIILFSGLASADLSAEVTAQQLPKKVYKIPNLEGPKGFRSIQQIHVEVTALDSLIGLYPPTYKTEAERDSTYSIWSGLLNEVHGIKTESQYTLALLSQLYRQGHNMDVKWAAKRSHENIQACITKYPESVACHLEATYLYLQINPPKIDLAEISLEKLTSYYAPEMREEIEAGYIFLYLYSKDEGLALAQIKKYLVQFPYSDRAKTFRQIQAAIELRGVEYQ
ncbi:hypothetical protein OAC10_00075 [bacterium]|nr:hypothetical protein [bacterium]